MQKVSDLYGGRLLKAADLNGQVHQLRIESVRVEEVGDEKKDKLVLYFAAQKKGCALNATNANRMATACGDDPAGWPGHTVELFSEPVSFNGKLVDGIRVRVVEQAQTSRLMTGTPEPAYQPAAAHDSNDGVPF